MNKIKSSENIFPLLCWIKKKERKKNFAAGEKMKFREIQLPISRSIRAVSSIH